MSHANFYITGMMTHSPIAFNPPASFQTEEKPVTYIQPPVDAVWLVSIEYRKHNEPKTLGPFRTKARAIQAVKDHIGEDMLDYTEYGSNVEEGNVYTEEETIETYWREIE